MRSSTGLSELEIASLQQSLGISPAESSGLLNLHPEATVQAMFDEFIIPDTSPVFFSSPSETTFADVGTEDLSTPKKFESQSLKVRLFGFSKCDLSNGCVLW